MYDAIIVGSGFAGSLLARLLAGGGRRVVLVERGRHPRFALGESTTPLANLALERIGRRHDVPELFELAAHGRWLSAFPEVRRGLKRGFSFYAHRPGERWAAGADNASRLLVAASPDDHVADTHWLREDVDSLLVRIAVAAGVELMEETEVDHLEFDGRGVRLSARRKTRPIEISGRVVIDGSGAGGFMAGALPVEAGLPLKTRSSLIFGHFEGIPLLEIVASVPAVPAAPYHEDWAAVHHLLEEGWLYLLRFDDGRVSAGLLIEDATESERLGAHPERSLRDVLERYPTLAALFMEASPVGPVGFRQPVQHRMGATHGPRWVVLPSAFASVDPLFSTGIAWSLLGVERLADVLLSSPPDDPGIASGEAFSRYGRLLEQEVEQIDRLVATAYRARDSFSTFASLSLLYFALVSFEEAGQRLCNFERPWWRGFLRADDPSSVALLEEAGHRLAGESGVHAGGFGAWVREAIEPFDIAGFSDCGETRLFGVDLEALVERSSRLGLSREAVRAALPRLRGFDPGPPG